MRDVRSKILTTKVSTRSRISTIVFTECGLQILNDIVMPDLRTSKTESSLEIDFFIGKIKHTVKRVRKEKPKK